MIKDEREQALQLEFISQTRDLLDHPSVRQMDQYIHHSDVTTLEHCLYVAFTAFKTAKKLKLDARAVARGAMLHDLYLYDWHKTIPPEGLHGFTHPGIAWRNARALFSLGPLEQDIILKHMWPLTLVPPRYGESLLVCLVDKHCALMEILARSRNRRLKTFKESL